MVISDRTKRLLEWWRLRIEKSVEESKEKNDKGNNSHDASDARIRSSNKTNERQ